MSATAAAKEIAEPTELPGQMASWGLNPRVERLPVLENGDRLTRAEFHRRYLARPDIKKAELIEGIVYIMSSPLSRLHGKPHAFMIFWLATYESRTPGVEVLDNVTTLLDADNEPQPDISMCIDPRCGGQTRVSKDDYIEGPPELIVEIANSSASVDLHAKKNVYRRRGVKEYIVWRVRDKALDWFVLEDDEYRRAEPDERGVIESNLFPGLRLAVGHLLAERRWDVMDELDKGIAAESHQAFIRRLGFPA